MSIALSTSQLRSSTGFCLKSLGRCWETYWSVILGTVVVNRRKVVPTGYEGGVSFCAALQLFRMAPFVISTSS